MNGGKEVGSGGQAKSAVNLIHKNDNGRLDLLYNKILK
jgi:hypothetical protein